MEKEVAKVKERISTANFAEVDQARIAPLGMEDGCRIEITVDKRTHLERCCQVISDDHFERVDFRCEREISDRPRPRIREIRSQELAVVVERADDWPLTGWLHNDNEASGDADRDNARNRSACPRELGSPLISKYQIRAGNVPGTMSIPVHSCPRVAARISL